MDCALSFRLPLTPTSFPTKLSTKLRLMRLRRSNFVEQQHRTHKLVIRKACASDENGFFNGSHLNPNKLFMEEAIGAEYGEGFETFRPDGPLKVDVDFLNDRLQEGFLKRIRYAMKPDEAYGLIFSWDNVVERRSRKTMIHKNFCFMLVLITFCIKYTNFSSSEVYIIFQIYQIYNVLSWEKEASELDRLKLRLSQLYYNNLIELSKPMEGVKGWLDAVSTARIPCAIVSSLDRRNMVEALNRMGLVKYFQAIVTEEDGMESMAHRLLSAAVKLDRKPSKCVVFEDDPRGITAAHNCTMMAIALIGAHPAYDLVQADLAVGSFNELSVINLRRLFAHKGSTFMELQKQIIEKTPPRRRLTIDTIF